MDFFTTIFEALGEAVLKVLPKSPFRGFLDMIGSFEFLGWLNWFFPVGDCLKVVAAWLVAIGLYYLYSIVLRWLKAIS